MNIYTDSNTDVEEAIAQILLENGIPVSVTVSERDDHVIIVNDEGIGENGEYYVSLPYWNNDVADFLWKLQAKLMPEPEDI